MPVSWNDIRPGRVVAALGALVVLASGAVPWVFGETAERSVALRGYEIEAGLSVMAAGALALGVLAFARQPRVRNALAGAAFVVTLLIAVKSSVTTEFERFYLGVLASSGIRIELGPGSLVAGAGAALGLAGVAWSLLERRVPVAAPVLPDDERWR